MFTGLIASLGSVERVTPRAGATRLAIRSPFPAGSLELGESVAVDGACLTVSRRAGAIFEADVVPETLARTTLARLRKGDVVHLERSLALGDRLGGHIVLGHVDAVAKVLALRRLRADVRLTVATPPELAGLVASKGSIALQGVSLTVSAVTAKSFEVALIPETLARTHLGAVRPGDGLNVEVDLLARYLDAWMRGRGLSRARAGSRTRST